MQCRSGSKQDPSFFFSPKVSKCQSGLTNTTSWLRRYLRLGTTTCTAPCQQASAFSAHVMYPQGMYVRTSCSLFSQIAWLVGVGCGGSVAVGGGGGHVRMYAHSFDRLWIRSTESMDTISLVPRKCRAPLKLFTQHHNIHRSPLSTIRVMFVVSTRPIIHTPGTSIPCSLTHIIPHQNPKTVSCLGWWKSTPHTIRVTRSVSSHSVIHNFPPTKPFFDSTKPFFDSSPSRRRHRRRHCARRHRHRWCRLRCDCLLLPLDHVGPCCWVNSSACPFLSTWHCVSLRDLTNLTPQVQFAFHMADCRTAWPPICLYGANGTMVVLWRRTVNVN